MYRVRGQDFRWQLLTTVSSLALLASMYSIQDAKAEDADRPTVWIELGGQLEQMNGGQEPFAPSFALNMPNTFFSPLNAQKSPQYFFGGEGTISVEPDGSDWVFSASVRFGRANGFRNKHQETPNAHVPVHITSPIYINRTKYPSSHVKFEDVKAKQSETSAVLDFQAGKDVGLGIFGKQGSSVLSAGIRFTQFSSKTSVTMRAEPDVHYPSQSINSITALIAFDNAAMHFHSYAGMETNQRSFRGVGPSVAWKASAPFVGNPDRGELTLDWGANAAILFGRQKAGGHHQTTVHGYYKKSWDDGSCPIKHNFANGFHTCSITHHSQAAGFNRARTVIVPNVGGFAGLSFSFTNAKISAGYRGDFFFGAMDTGNDTRTTKTVGFYGPFATISIGLGG